MNKTLDNIKNLIKDADCILIGAGSGLSSALYMWFEQEV